MKDPGDRDDPAGGIRQPALGPGPHRRGAHRARRDVLRRRGGRGLYPRERGAPICWARIRCASTSIRRMLLDTYRRLQRQRASRCAASRPSTSRSGTSSARRSGQPIHQLLGGLSRDRIRIYNTCAGYRYVRGTARTRSPATGASGGEPGALRGPRRLPQPCRRAGAEPARAGHHRHEDLAVRPYAEAQRRACYISGRRSRQGAGALPQDPQARSATGWTSWSSSTRLWNLPTGQAHLRGARGVRPVLVRGPDQA